MSCFFPFDSKRFCSSFLQLFFAKKWLMPMESLLLSELLHLLPMRTSFFFLFSFDKKVILSLGLEKKICSLAHL
jgi:hypothetical protein